MIHIQKTKRQMLFIFHRTGNRAAWIFDGQQFLRFAYLPTTQEFRFVRTQANLPPGVRGEPFVLNELEVRSLQREAARWRLNLRFFNNHYECILHALPVNLQQTVFDLIPPAGSVTASGITTRHSAPPWNRRSEED